MANHSPLTPIGGKELLATGVAGFAAVTILLIGVFQILQGIVAVADDSFYVTTRNYTFDLDTTAWGWLHIVLGVIGIAVGIGLLRGALLARVAAVTIASLSALANFLWIPYYPVWAIVIITLDVLVIWAVTRYDSRDIAS